MKILKKKFRKIFKKSVFFIFKNFFEIPYGKSQLQGFEKIYVGRLFSGYLKLEVLGAWMTFKKAEMAKTLENGLSMIETNGTNPLNHNWSHFVILSGLTLHQFKKILLLRVIFDQWPKLNLGFDVEPEIRILKVN